MSSTYLIDNETSEYSFLSEITSILSSSFNIKDTLSRIFELLNEHLGLTKGILTLLRPGSSSPTIEMVYGLTEEEMKHSALLKWKMITEEVISSQCPTIIPKLDDSTLLLGDHDTETLTDESFICLPLSLSGEKIGTLSIDCPFRDDETLYRNCRLLSIVTLMISQEIMLKRLLDSEKSVLRNENLKLRDELHEKYNIHNMIGKSSRMIEVYESIKQVANANATVLIRGDSGTGKELVSHSIHYNSTRSSHPFIKINCGAIPESLIESELFGYEKGAFTDAQSRKIGRIEAANKGTLFLDEIGELSPAIQVKLLRVLQEKEFTRVGGIKPISVDVRVVAATNRDLEKQVEEGQFRQDLYYRLNVFPIFLPALRERQSDVLLLSEHFLDRYTVENNKKISRISAKASDLLMRYAWPGNVRELENCMERAVIVCDEDTVESWHLPPTLRSLEESDEPLFENETSLATMTRNYERKLIIQALTETNGNQAKAARLLNTTQRIIGYKIKQLNIQFDQVDSVL